jgi:hypothetical protein
MDEFLFVAMIALIWTLMMVVAPYLILFALTNVVYRLVSGRFFRWMSWRTVVPFLLVFFGGWGFLIYVLFHEPVFVITH